MHLLWWYCAPVTLDIEPVNHSTGQSFKALVFVMWFGSSHCLIASRQVFGPGLSLVITASGKRGGGRPLREEQVRLASKWVDCRGKTKAGEWRLRGTWVDGGDGWEGEEFGRPVDGVGRESWACKQLQWGESFPCSISRRSCRNSRWMPLKNSWSSSADGEEMRVWSRSASRPMGHRESWYDVSRADCWLRRYLGTVSC